MDAHRPPIGTVAPNARARGRVGEGRAVVLPQARVSMRQDAIAVLSPPSPHHGSRYHSPRHRTRQGQRCRQHPRVSDVHSVADLVDLVTILRVVENDARANPSRTTSARSTAVGTRPPPRLSGPLSARSGERVLDRNGLFHLPLLLRKLRRTVTRIPH
jgi:hypothetical protein